MQGVGCRENKLRNKKNPAASHKARSREGGKPLFVHSYDLVFSQPLNVFLGHAKHRLQNLFGMLA